jgi:hypothetical protein
LRKATISFFMSVRPHGTRLFHWTDFDKIWYLFFFLFQNICQQNGEFFRILYSLTRMTGNLGEDVYIFITISRWIILRMRNGSDKSWTENQNIILRSIIFLPKIVLFMRYWRNIWWSQTGYRWPCNRTHALRMTDSKATREHAHVQVRAHPPIHTHTHTQKYVLLIVFPQQQWCRERASMLRCTYIFFSCYSMSPLFYYCV